MKISRLSAMALAAAAVGCAMGMDCGGMNLNGNTNSNTPVITCGPGTQPYGGVCVLSQSANTN